MSDTSLSERVLFVDDEPAVLDAIRRTHRKAFDLRTAVSGEEGLRCLQVDGPFAVVVSDYRMPGMNGAAFLRHVHDMAPETVRVILTGDVDLQTAIESVNQGRIFRFLTKPCGPEVLTGCLEAAIEQFRLRHAERELLEHTVRGSIEILTDVLAISNPDAFGRSKRVQTYVRQLADGLELRDPWRHETAALLSQIGLISIPSEIIEGSARGEPLSDQQREMLDRHPSAAKEMLEKIPRLEQVAEIVAHQRLRHTDVAASGLDPETALAAQVLALALDFDACVLRGATRSEAMREMTMRRGSYDPRLLLALGNVRLPAQDTLVQSLSVKSLRPGMLLDEDLTMQNGTKVAPKGYEITSSMLARLRNYAELGQLPTSVRVRVAIAQGEKPTRVA